MNVRVCFQSGSVFVSSNVGVYRTLQNKILSTKLEVSYMQENCFGSLPSEILYLRSIIFSVNELMGLSYSYFLIKFYVLRGYFSLSVLKDELM